MSCLASSLAITRIQLQQLGQSLQAPSVMCFFGNIQISGSSSYQLVNVVAFFFLLFFWLALLEEKNYSSSIRLSPVGASTWEASWGVTCDCVGRVSVSDLPSPGRPSLFGFGILKELLVCQELANEPTPQSGSYCPFVVLGPHQFLESKTVS